MTAVRDELEVSPQVEHVVFALRGGAAFEAFAHALAADEPAPSRPLLAPGCLAARRRPARPRPACRRSRRPGARTRAGVSFSAEPIDERREALVEAVAREIRLRGLTGPAVHFLEASRPYRPLGAPAMLFFDPVLHDLFGGQSRSATELMGDDVGIEALIDRLEELDEVDGWDA